MAELASLLSSVGVRDYARSVGDVLADALAAKDSDTICLAEDPVVWMPDEQLFCHLSSYLYYVGRDATRDTDDIPAVFMSGAENLSLMDVVLLKHHSAEWVKIMLQSQYSQPICVNSISLADLLATVRQRMEEREEPVYSLRVSKRPLHVTIPSKVDKLETISAALAVQTLHQRGVQAEAVCHMEFDPSWDQYPFGYEETQLLNSLRAEGMSSYEQATKRIKIHLKL